MKLIHRARSFTIIGVIICIPILFASILFAQNAPSSQSNNASAQGNSQSSQTTVPAFKSSSNLALVDVVVTHNGEPIKGLQRDAFHVFEGGREQTVKVFEEHTAAEAAQIQKPSVPPATYTNFPDSTAGSANILLLDALRSEEHTSELQSLTNLVCRLLLEKKKQKRITTN